MPTFDYYCGDESCQFSFCRIPRQLITGKAFKGLSADAKLLYALMLERMGLSAQNGWHDEQGHVFIYYTVNEIRVAFNCGNDKAIKGLAELDIVKGIGLIERVKQGQGRPTKIFVKNFSKQVIQCTFSHQSWRRHLFDPCSVRYTGGIPNRTTHPNSTRSRAYCGSVSATGEKHQHSQFGKSAWSGTYTK